MSFHVNIASAREIVKSPKAESHKGGSKRWAELLQALPNNTLQHLIIIQN